MPGEINRLINRILVERAKGDPTLFETTKTKLILKGLDPDRFNASSTDDPKLLERVKIAGRELGVKL